MTEHIEHTSKPEHSNGNTNVALKEYFSKWIDGLERILTERDRRYEERTHITEESVSSRFRAAEIAVSAALAAQEKAVNAAFLASEKAIIKAENAQSDYNMRSNEFRGQLDDQAKTLMSKDYAESKFTSIDNRIEESKIISDARVGEIKKLYDGKIDDLKKEIQVLRDYRSEIIGKSGVTDPILAQLVTEIRSLSSSRSTTEGRGAGANQLWLIIVAAVSVAGGLLAILFRFIPAP